MKPRPRQAIILAGGRGTRLRPLTDTIPKPMLPFHGKPFLGYVVEMLRDQGFERVLLLLGYLAESIVEHFGDGSSYGVEIEYEITDADDLTSYRVARAADRLDELFLLLYCDNYWPMRFEDMWTSFVRSGAPAQVTVYANRDDYSRDSVRVDGEGYVAVFDRSRATPGLRGVEISYAILDKATILPLLPTEQMLFEEAVYPKLVEQRLLHAFLTEHRYYSVGGHDRLARTDAFLARSPAVIVDRDGVLNERPPRAQYVRRPDEIRWLPDALESLRLLNEAGWRVIVASNQAGVARGAMTESDLARVNEQMRQDAVTAGGRIDAIYTCTHGWDDGCDCRKPRPGLLFQAQRDFDLDLTRTTFVGDDERDAAAALAAGCRPLLLGEGESLLGAAQLLLAEHREEALL